MTEEPSLYDYLVGLIAVLQDEHKKLEEKKKLMKKLEGNFAFLKDAKSITMSTIPEQIGQIAKSLDMAMLHNKTAQRRISDAMEMVKKAQK